MLAKKKIDPHYLDYQRFSKEVVGSCTSHPGVLGSIPGRFAQTALLEESQNLTAGPDGFSGIGPIYWRVSPGQFFLADCDGL
jgi:hypothetical protein